MGVIGVLELSSEMCSLAPEDMMCGIPIILEDDALSYFGPLINKKAKNYQEAIDMLMSWFTSDERQARLHQQMERNEAHSVLPKQSGETPVGCFLRNDYKTQ